MLGGRTRWDGEVAVEFDYKTWPVLDSCDCNKNSRGDRNSFEIVGWHEVVQS